MGVDVFCVGLQAFLDSALSAEDITKNINKFFLNLLVRTINLDEIKEKIIKLLFSSKALDLDEWEKLLKENILDNEAEQTSNKVVKMALDDAKNNMMIPLYHLFLYIYCLIQIWIYLLKLLNILI